MVLIDFLFVVFVFLMVVGVVSMIADHIPASWVE